MTTNNRKPNNVANLDDQRPNFIFECDAAIHVVPVKFFQDVANGKTDIRELDCFDSILPVIIGEYLQLRGEK